MFAGNAPNNRLPETPSLFELNVRTKQFWDKASDHGLNQSMQCAHLNGQHGATGEQNITQGQLLLDVCNCMLLVHLQCLLHHNQSDTNTTHINTRNKTDTQAFATYSNKANFLIISALNTAQLHRQRTTQSCKKKRKIASLASLFTSNNKATICPLKLH